MWVAMYEVRIKARPSGTAGETTGLAKTPSSCSRKVILKAAMSSPTTSGITGDAESPVLNPMVVNSRFM